MKSSSKKSAIKWLLGGFTAFTLTISLAGCSQTAEESPELEKTTDASLAETADYVPASADGPAQNVPEPRLPISATEKSEGGAKATLEYFWEAIDYGRLTGDTTYAELVSSDTCALCSDLISGWKRVYEEDSWAVLHGKMALKVQDVNTEDEAKESIAGISFIMTEPAVDFYEAGKYLEEDSFDTESSADWWAELSFDETSERWQIEWIGVEDHLSEDQQ
ncbi:DUF6318 family protein [Enteractinococcus helveticum]|uniref:DUF6318 domain-containing protein n=1 Tax=Enteractinococcus helveticum TaxID=1837282 RepID=A0A1B7LXN5_9MICC|nr:DUF6318 family protein [Enteractinococcus helveticum]OAV59934.1 hypothetical protein A6F49_14415 [Enteractinococcus helveticum]